MALQLALTDTNVGLPAPEGYARIAGVQIDLLADKIGVAVNVYANRAARDAGKNPVAGGVFEGKVSDGNGPALDAGPLFPACYTWLKSLPAFSGATDVP